MDDPLQALESCANIVKQVSETVAPQRSAMVERIKRLIEAATGESEEGDRRGRLKFLAPEWPEEVLVELAMLYFQVCGRDMQLSVKQGDCAVDADDYALVLRCADLVESLMLELRAEAKKMDEQGTNVEPEPEPEFELQVDVETFDAIAHAMFERYQTNGRVAKDDFNRMGVDMDKADAAEMPENIWDKICDDVGAAQEAGFNFFQFGDFFKNNQSGLAQLHAGVYNVNLDSVARRADWDFELWGSMGFKPGARVELQGLVGAAHYNGCLGTVMGLHRVKERYCVQLDPEGDVPREGEQVKHLSIKGANLTESEVQREGFRSKHWSTMRVLRPTPPRIEPTLTDEAISGMSIGEMKALIAPFGGLEKMLEKRDFVERLKHLRDAAIQAAQAPAPKVVTAPTPDVPTAKEVSPIDPDQTDEDIEKMSLADLKEILRFHGGFADLVERVDFTNRLKELRDGERASIAAVRKEMERERLEQERARTPQ